MTSLDDRTIAAHVLCELGGAHARRAPQARLRLDELAAQIGVRRADVRRVVSALHAEGFVDAQRLRLTLSGFALAVALDGRRLRTVRTRTDRDLRRVA